MGARSWRPRTLSRSTARRKLPAVDAFSVIVRARHGKAHRTHAEVQAQVRRHQRELTDREDAHWRPEPASTDSAPGSDRLVVYEKPTCSTCQRVVRLLEERGIEFERVDYHVHPLPAARIAELLGKSGVSPRDALRPREPAAQALLERGASDEEVVAALAADPALLQRPLVERGARAVLARPAERVLTLL